MDLSTPTTLPPTLGDTITYRELTAGQVLFHQGDPAQAVFVVETGRLRLERNTREGKMVVFRVVRAGESLAESALVLDTYPYDAVVEERSRLIVYPQHLLRPALREYPDLAADLIERLVKKNQFLQSRLELRSIRKARDRVLHYLLIAAQPGETTVNFDRPLKDIASDLGLTPEVFYRTLARLEREGAITRVRQQITINTSAA